jgi:cell division protein FtsZ
VTRPFGFEGKRRAVQAETGIERLRAEVDTLIVIPNDRLLSISDRHVSVLDAFKAADQVLLSGVQGITDLITTPGLINLDFADVKSVMSGAGSALMGIGSSRGDDRAVAAAEMAISSPLLEASIDGAHGVLLSIQGGSDLGLFEINEAAQLVSNSAAVDANIIFGAVIDDALGDEVRVTVIAAGFDESRSGRPAGATAVTVGRPQTPPPVVPVGPGGLVNGAGSNGGAGGTGTVGAGPGTAPAGHTAGSAGAGAPVAAAWAGNGAAARGDASQAAEPPASDPGPSATQAPSAPSPAGTGGTWSIPGAADPQAAVFPAPGAGQPRPEGQPVAAEPAAETPAQPVSDGPSGYVPSPVSFVSEDDEYGSKPGYDGYDSGRGPDAAPGGAAPGNGQGWRDSGRAGKQDKVFDVPAGRRRPVVFEEEDDLDVPDFLK